MSAGGRIRLPADVEMEDRLAWGLTARQLVILGVTAIVCYGVFSAASSVLPTPVAAALAVPLALVGVALALGRLDGLTGDRIALAAARHLTQSPRRVAAPEGLPGKLTGAPGEPGVSLLRVPVSTILTSGVVELADGTSVLLLGASATSWALRSIEEQAALAEAYGKWLNSLTEPAAITVRSELVDLDGSARARSSTPRTGSPTLRCATAPTPTRSSSTSSPTRAKACAAVKSCSCSAPAAASARPPRQTSSAAPARQPGCCTPPGLSFTPSTAGRPPRCCSTRWNHQDRPPAPNWTG